MKAGEDMPTVSFLFYTLEYGQKALNQKSSLNLTDKWMSCVNKSMKKDTVLNKNYVPEKDHDVKYTTFATVPLISHFSFN